MRFPIMCVSLVVAATLLAGCGDKPSESTKPAAPAPAPAAKDQQLMLTYFTMPG